MKLRKLGIIGAAGALAVSAAVPAFAQAPEDELGVVSIPAGEPVHIAFWGVLTGPDSTLGIDSQRGIEIALEDRDNKVIAHLGYNPEWTRQVLDGFKMRTNPQQWQAGRFVHPHDACFDRDGNIFVVEWVSTGRVSKLRKVS